MIIDYLKKISEEYKFLPEILVTLGGAALILKSVRSWAGKFFIGIYNWFIFPFKSQDIRKEILSEISGLKSELQKNTKISEKTAVDVDSLKQIVGHNGGGGLLDMVGVLAGFQQSEFWLRPQPGFIADEDGRNVDVTHAYSIMLGLSSKSDLAGISWKSYTDREKSGSYLNEFKDAASRREPFRGRIELFDVNSISKGSWIVVAHPISSEKAKSKRYLSYLYPGDQVSRDVAKAYGWPMNVPI